MASSWHREYVRRPLPAPYNISMKRQEHIVNIDGKRFNVEKDQATNNCALHQISELL